MLALATLGGQAPLVLALAGLPGAGKSTLAAGLSRMTGWPVLDRDAIRAERWPAEPAHSVRHAADEVLTRRVGSGIRAGLCLLVDGKSWASAADRSALAEVVADAGGRLQWVELVIGPEIAKTRVRISAAAHPADDRVEALVDAVLARFEPLGSECWRLDASRTPEQVLQDCLGHLVAELSAICLPGVGCSGSQDRADS
jgi:predicted kinase